jgi:two-component system, chemotaxis family, sensor kinase CheA
MQETHAPNPMDDILKDFLIESTENLDHMDRDLVSLEADPTSQELLASIFRTIHTIKGSCGFLGFKHLERVTHAGEDLLLLLRDGQLKLTQEVAGGLLEMVDSVRKMLEEIRATGADGAYEYSGLMDRLRRLQGGEVTAGECGQERREGPEKESPVS